MKENFAFNKGFTQLLNFKRNWSVSIPGFFSRLYGLLNSLYIFLGPHRKLFKRARLFSGQKISSPLYTRYWSTTPYSLGDTNIVKYMIVPHAIFDTKLTGKDCLKLNLKSHITKRDAGFTFGIILQNGASSIDNLSTDWMSEGGEFIPLADILIPIHSDEEMQVYYELAESLSFSPWNTPYEHRPLGIVNETRRVVYEKMASERKEISTVA